MPLASTVRTLVVDDQPSMRELTRQSLLGLGFFGVQEAPDGEEALRMMIKQPFHLVISDMEMPKFDGLSLLRAIRAHPPIASTGFILLTGVASPEIVQRAVKFGVNNYIVKPVKMSVLKQKIEDVLGPLV
jgi:two-component system, chemotaxis family, chemotaxis protein CheY